MKFARYIALQFIRTADYKDIISALYELDHPEESLTDKTRTEIHIKAMWDLGALEAIEAHIRNAIWIFGKNNSHAPFWASDNPVAFKTANNRMWLKAGFISKGTYVVFPISPSIVMYCHEREYWCKLSEFDCKISPVTFDRGMVQHENAGQVFMASRFIISPEDDFQFGRDFLPSIGTNMYASDGWESDLVDMRPLLRENR